MNRKGFRDPRFDDIAAYALDALTPEERRQVDDLLVRSDDARRELASMQEAAAAIVLGVPQAEPPASLKARLLAAAGQKTPDRLRVAESRNGAAATVSSPGHVSAVAKPRARPGWVTSAAAAGSIVAIAAAVMLAVLFGTRTQRLQTDLDQVNSQLAQGRAEMVSVQATMTSLQLDLASASERTGAQGQQVSDLAEVNKALKGEIRDQRWVTYVTMNRDWDAPSWFRGSAEMPAAQGQIIVRPQGDRGVRVGDGLPALPAGSVYKLWLFDASSKVAVADFDVNEVGYALVEFRMPASLGNFTNAAITRVVLAERQSPGIEVLSAPAVR